MIILSFENMDFKCYRAFFKSKYIETNLFKAIRFDHRLFLNNAHEIFAAAAWMTITPTSNSRCAASSMVSPGSTLPPNPTEFIFFNTECVAILDPLTIPEIHTKTTLLHSEKDLVEMGGLVNHPLQ